MCTRGGKFVSALASWPFPEHPFRTAGDGFDQTPGASHTARPMSLIPGHLHFVWIGETLPLFARLAIQSALTRSPLMRATLWASGDLERDPEVQALRSNERFMLARLDESTLMRDAASTLPLDVLARALAALKTPAARANLARLLLLAQHGGIYLDTDTTTLRDLAPLCALSAFAGLERVIWPLDKRYGIRPYRLIGGPLRGLVRNWCARSASGVSKFQKIERFYPTALNNAVLGFAPNHPFLTAALTRVAELSDEEQLKRYRLGTHLLQETYAACGKQLGVHALAPSAFYPLGPEISRQYFRAQPDITSFAAQVLTPETYLVHWYASVSELLAYDRARILSEREQTLFARLNSEYVA